MTTHLAKASILALSSYLLSMAPAEAAPAGPVGLDLKVDTKRVVIADDQTRARALQTLHEAVTQDPILRHWPFSRSPVPDGLNLVFHVPASGEDVARYANIGMRLERRKGGRQDGPPLRRSRLESLWSAEQHSISGTLETNEFVRRIRTVFEERFLLDRDHGSELLTWLREEVPIGEAAWDTRADQESPLVVTSIPEARVGSNAKMQFAMVVITTRGPVALCAIGVGTTGEGWAEGAGGRGQRIQGLNFLPQQFRLGLRKEEVGKDFDRARIPQLEFVYLHHVGTMGRYPTPCF